MTNRALVSVLLIAIGLFTIYQNFMAVFASILGAYTNLSILGENWVFDLVQLFAINMISILIGALAINYSQKLATLLIKVETKIELSMEPEGVLTLALYLVFITAVIDQASDFLNNFSVLFQINRLPSQERLMFNKQNMIQFYANLFESVVIIFFSVWGITKTKFIARKLAS